MKNPFATRFTIKEWLFASPGIVLVLIGGIGVNSGWPNAFWILFTGFAYQPFALAVLSIVRKT